LVGDAPSISCRGSLGRIVAQYNRGTGLLDLAADQWVEGYQSDLAAAAGGQSVAMAAGLRGNVGVQCTAPGFSTSFAGLVSCHCGIAVAEVLTDNVWAGEVVDEAADAATSHSLRHPQ
jgi:hypothetical protein